MAYSVTEFQPREIIFKQGDAGELMYLVKEGEVEVLQELGGGEQQVAVLERGDFFGEMAVLDEQPRSHSVRALTHTKLVVIDRSGFQQMLQRNAEISVRMIRKLGQRLAHTEDMLLRAYAGQVVLEEEPAAGAAAPANARLMLLGDHSEISLPDKPEVSVGRADPAHGIHPDVDLTAIDDQLTTSRRHALLLRRGGGFFIQEEQATNGTFVNGQRISAERPLEIRSGDEITFGVVATRFLWS